MKLKSFNKFCEDNSDYVTKGGMRWEIFNEDANGLAESGAIIRNGRKILIDEDCYLEWLLSKNGRAAA